MDIKFGKSERYSDGYRATRTVHVRQDGECIALLESDADLEAERPVWDTWRLFPNDSMTAGGSWLLAGGVGIDTGKGRLKDAKQSVLDTLEECVAACGPDCFTVPV